MFIENVSKPSFYRLFNKNNILSPKWSGTFYNTQWIILAFQNCRNDGLFISITCRPTKPILYFIAIGHSG